MSEKEFVKANILLVSHGQLCLGVYDSARMIGADLEHVVALPLLEGISPADYEVDVRKVLDTFPKGSIVIADLFGGTPFNVLAKILPEYEGIYVATGLNLPMVLEICAARSFVSGEDLLNMALNAGKEGVTNVNEFVKSLLESSNNSQDDDEDI